MIKICKYIVLKLCHCLLTQDGETILHKAALGGKTEVVRMLVDAGVNVNAKNIVSVMGWLWLPNLY